MTATRTPAETTATLNARTGTVTLKLTAAEALAVAYVLGKGASEITFDIDREVISPTYYAYCALADATGIDMRTTTREIREGYAVAIGVDPTEVG